MQAAEQQSLPRRRDYTDELLRAFPNGQVVNAEGSVVDLPFQLASGRPTALRVSLPAHFPHDRPVLCVLVPLQHPAVDSSGRVHVQGINQWGVNQQRAGAAGGSSGIAPPDLVAVVREAFAVLLGEAANQHGLMGAAGGGSAARDARMIALSGGVGGQQQLYGAGGAPSGRIPAGVEPKEYLESLPTSQLEAMLRDEEALKKAAAIWLKDTPGARALDDIRSRNRFLADSNLDLARSIEEARGHVAIVRSGEYAAMRALFEGLYGRQEAVVAKMGNPKILARVRDEADKADAASDELLERYQAGSLPVDAFVEQYGAAREAFHIIDLKRQAAEHSMLA